MDGERLKYDNPFVRKLDMYLINYLNLPSVGEFSMEGEGKFVIEKRFEIYSLKDGHSYQRQPHKPTQLLSITTYEKRTNRNIQRRDRWIKI